MSHSSRQCDFTVFTKYTLHLETCLSYEAAAGKNGAGHHFRESWRTFIIVHRRQWVITVAESTKICSWIQKHKRFYLFTRHDIGKDILCEFEKNGLIRDSISGNKFGPTAFNSFRQFQFIMGCTEEFGTGADVVGNICALFWSIFDNLQRSCEAEQSPKCSIWKPKELKQPGKWSNCIFDLYRDYKLTEIPCSIYGIYFAFPRNIITRGFALFAHFSRFPTGFAYHYWTLKEPWQIGKKPLMQLTRRSH